MADPQDLSLVGLVPALADDVYASAGVELQLYLGGRAVEPGAPVAAREVQSQPRVDINGEGLFTMLVVGMGSGGPQELAWLLADVPDFDFGLGLQVVSYLAPQLAPPFRLAFLLYRQPGDEPMDVHLSLHCAEEVPHKLNEPQDPTDSWQGARREGRAGFDAKGFAAAHHLGLPVAVAWVAVA